MKFLITGSTGFIGSAVIRHIIDNTEHSVVNVDKLTYAGNLESLKPIESDTRYSFEQGYITKEQLIELAQPLAKNQYGRYLLKCAEGLV